MNRNPMILLRRLLLAALLLPALAWASADPQISEFTDSPDPVNGGTDYTYTVVVRNSGGSPATTTRLTLDVPSGATFVSAAAAPAGSCSATTATQVVCELGSVAGGNTDVRTVTVVWKAGLFAALFEVNATATLTADADADATNNVQTQKTTVNVPTGPSADLRITSKTIASGIPVAAGSAVTFRLTPRNGGPATATGVTVTDVLPTGWTFVSAAGPSWTGGAAPAPGITGTLEVRGTPPTVGGSVGFVLEWIGFSPRANNFGVSLSLLDPGLVGCHQWAPFEVSWSGTANAAGIYTTPLPLPSSAALGTELGVQAAWLDLSRTGLPLSFSNGVVLRLGPSGVGTGCSTMFFPGAATVSPWPAFVGQMPVLLLEH
jgi:uncharacterized repeat protein (TIGR01451 family)